MFRGRAIAGASVWLVNEMEEKVADARTDRDGKFIITVALPGKYWLEVRKEGFRQARVELGRSEQRTEPAFRRIYEDTGKGQEQRQRGFKQQGAGIFGRTEFHDCRRCGLERGRRARFGRECAN